MIFEAITMILGLMRDWTRPEANCVFTLARVSLRGNASITGK